MAVPKKKRSSKTKSIKLNIEKKSIRPVTTKQKINFILKKTFKLNAKNFLV
jgi:hypothetical protein